MQKHRKMLQNSPAQPLRELAQWSRHSKDASSLLNGRVILSLELKGLTVSSIDEGMWLPSHLPTSQESEGTRGMAAQSLTLQRPRKTRAVSAPT